MGAIKMMIVTVVMAVITAATSGEVYEVGDDRGWTSVGHVDYKKWASTKSFRVGDTIVFSYVKQFHDVARVSYADYKTCNNTKPYTIFTSGHDSFTIKYPGHYFFICTQLNHCAAGEKVDIRVLPIPQNHSAPPPVSASSPAPVQPLPFPYPQPYVPSPSPVTTPLSPVTPPSQAPSVSRSRPPLVPEKSPTSAPVVPAPEVAPSEQKSKASQLGFEVKIWMTIMVVRFYLIGFSF